jgi:hypothetical protein
MQRMAVRAAAPKPTQAVLVGASNQRLQELLKDTLKEIGVELRAPQGKATPADIVLAVVGKDDTERAVAEARRGAGRGLVVAILPFEDPHRARQAMAAGASATYALDAPLGRLRAQLLRLLGEPLGDEAMKGRAPGASFSLGLRAKSALSAIRASRKEPSHQLPDDAESRLEQAIQMDLYVKQLRGEGGEARPHGPVSFRAHAQVELMMMHFSSFETALLEQAISADLSRLR